MHGYLFRFLEIGSLDKQPHLHVGTLTSLMMQKAFVLYNKYLFISNIRITGYSVVNIY